MTFPLRERCPACASADVSRTLLPERGTLWTWTIQGFEPKSPPYVPDGEFAPFAVGYVEFPGYLRVEGRLTEGDPGAAAHRDADARRLPRPRRRLARTPSPRPTRRSDVSATEVAIVGAGSIRSAATRA